MKNLLLGLSLSLLLVICIPLNLDFQLQPNHTYYIDTTIIPEPKIMLLDIHWTCKENGYVFSC